VLDLGTGRVSTLAETRSVDDQATWIDSATVAYTVRADDGRPSIWSVPADGTSRPTLLLAGAESPAPLDAPGGTAASGPDRSPGGPRSR
jgi:hypothetical protein